MTLLLVGFDSAWTPTNSGAVAGVLQRVDGTFRQLGGPQVANFPEAERLILDWQIEHRPTSTIVTLDQPTIVPNASGQRPVENIVGSAVSLRYGGMQPANTARIQMFGEGAPVWPFLFRFGGPGDPLRVVSGTLVLETYPVLVMIALGWMIEDARIAGRLPKYNPGRRKTFSLSDWAHVAKLTENEFRSRQLTDIADWIAARADDERPRKRDQDCLDACLCLIVALQLAEGLSCLMVGDLASGYIVAPFSSALATELEARCRATSRDPSVWVRRFQLQGLSQSADET